MKNLEQSGLWAMLRNPETTAGIAQADAALNEFAIELHRFCRDEKDLAERHHTLTFARGLLTAPREHGQKQTELSEHLSGVAAALIEGELEILKMELEHPERFVSKNQPPAPLALWNGTIADLLELLTAVHLAGKLLKPTYEPMTYADVISFIRNVFGLRVDRPYDRKSKLLARSKGGAPFLAKLTAVYLGKVEDAHK